MKSILMLIIIISIVCPFNALAQSTPQPSQFKKEISADYIKYELVDDIFFNEEKTVTNTNPNTKEQFDNTRAFLPKVYIQIQGVPTPTFPAEVQGTQVFIPKGSVFMVAKTDNTKALKSSSIYDTYLWQTNGNYVFISTPPQYWYVIDWIQALKYRGILPKISTCDIKRIDVNISTPTEY